jgi:hypothetical protein
MTVNQLVKKVCAFYLQSIRNVVKTLIDMEHLRACFVFFTYFEVTHLLFGGNEKNKETLIQDILVYFPTGIRFIYP